MSARCVGVGSRREEQHASYLQDYCADELDTLDYGVLIPRYRHPSLSGVGQQIPRHLYLSSSALQMIGVLKKRLSLMPRIRQGVITMAWLSFRVLLPDLLTSYSILTACPEKAACLTSGLVRLAINEKSPMVSKCNSLHFGRYILNVARLQGREGAF